MTSTGAQDPPPALEAVGLTKAFARVAVDGLDLAVRAGEVYALLGPNGAGKTTTLRMACGLLAPDAGTVRVFGLDMRERPQAAKRLIAWMPDEPLVYDRLNPVEYLAFVAGLWGVEGPLARERAEGLLRDFSLWEHRRERCEGFSRGMKQKLALAGALIHDPRLLILDEPLTGLDAAAARQVKALLLARVRQGGAVILTTHILEVAERLADRIGVIVGGEIVAGGTPATLGGRDRMDARIRFSPPAGAAPLPAALLPLAEAGADGAVTLRSESPLRHVGMLADWAVRGGFDLPDLDVRRPTLEDVYLSLTAADRKDRS